MIFSYVDKDNRFLIMRLIVIALILAVALSAPAADRMTKIPVLSHLLRDTLLPTIPAFIPDISMSKMPIGQFIMFLLSL